MSDETTVFGIPRVDPHARAKWKRAMAWWLGGVVIATKPGAAIWRRIAAPFDAPIMKATDGRVKLTGVPLVVLTHAGAKTGKLRETPLTYVTDGDDVIVVASNFGGEKHPSWYHNLRANPECELHVGSRGGKFTAREVVGPERDRLFALANALYPGFDRYAKRTQGTRMIKVLKLTPALAERSP
jgi:deazaflavin-dependent oxidoreductase (nitroreductase family)